MKNKIAILIILLAGNSSIAKAADIQIFDFAELKNALVLAEAPISYTFGAKLIIGECTTISGNFDFVDKSEQCDFVRSLSNEKSKACLLTIANSNGFFFDNSDECRMFREMANKKNESSLNLLTKQMREILSKDGGDSSSQL